MTLRQQIVFRVSVNVPWALVWIELRSGYVAGWIFEIRSALGV